MHDKDVLPTQWKRGRIIQIFPGKDGLVRSVLVKTASGQYERSVTRICVLPVDTAHVRNPNLDGITTRNDPETNPDDPQNGSGDPSI